MENLDTLLAYKAMFRFLENYWERGGRESDEIGGLLGSMNMDLCLDGKPADPAMWSDWLDAIKEVMGSQGRQLSEDVSEIDPLWGPSACRTCGSR